VPVKYCCARCGYKGETGHPVLEPMFELASFKLDPRTTGATELLFSHHTREEPLRVKLYRSTNQTRGVVHFNVPLTLLDKHDLFVFYGEALRTFFAFSAEDLERGVVGKRDDRKIHLTLSMRKHGRRTLTQWLKDFVDA